MSPLDSKPLLKVDDLKVHFSVNQSLLSKLQKNLAKKVRAVDGVSFSIPPGTSFGIVGESGSGKTTTALAIMRLLKITSGEVSLDGDNISAARGEVLRKLRRGFQMVFQDPFASLNPRKRVGDIVKSALDLMKIGEPHSRDDRVAELFKAVGLSPEQRLLFPHQFSGGQRQRIVIARALAAEPKLLVCDEPVSALDVAIQAQILNLLMKLRKDFGLTMLFISHDLGVVRHICDEVAVMYLGVIVEQGPAQAVFDKPLHPYTNALMSALPSFDPRQRGRNNRLRLTGDPPSPIDLPPGCRFANRCPSAISKCNAAEPPLIEIEKSRWVRCSRLERVNHQWIIPTDTAK
jgi:peptide/nickel transport system ATP-binding protein